MTDPKKDPVTTDDKPAAPDLTAEQISRLNKLVWDIDDDQAEWKGDLSEEDIQSLKNMLL